MSAKTTNPRNTTSSFSKSEKIRRNPFNRRNTHPILLCRLCISRSYSQGSTRVCNGGTTGSYRRANCRVSSPWQARSMFSLGLSCSLPSRLKSLRPSGVSWAFAGVSENVMAVPASAATT